LCGFSCETGYNDGHSSKRPRRASPKREDARAVIVAHYHPAYTASSKHGQSTEETLARVTEEQPVGLVHVNHTLADVRVVSAVDRKPLERPWLSLAIDVAIRAGFYLSLKPPSALSVALALRRPWRHNRGVVRQVLVKRQFDAGPITGVGRLW
jgi:hypothetical protein